MFLVVDSAAELLSFFAKLLDKTTEAELRVFAVKEFESDLALIASIQPEHSREIFIGNTACIITAVKKESLPFLFVESDREKFILIINENLTPEKEKLYKDNLLSALKGYSLHGIMTFIEKSSSLHPQMLLKEMKAFGRKKDDQEETGDAHSENV